MRLLLTNDDGVQSVEPRSIEIVSRGVGANTVTARDIEWKRYPAEDAGYTPTSSAMT
jgi:hypothetical protein